MGYTFTTKEEILFHKNEFLEEYKMTSQELVLFSNEIIKNNYKALRVQIWYQDVEDIYQQMLMKTENNEDYGDLDFSNVGEIPFTFDEIIQPTILTFEEYKEKKIRENWELVNKFQKKRLSDGGLSYCMIMKVQLQNQKCIDNCAWADNLWKQYYQAKYLINTSTTKEEIDSLPLATLNIPELPWGLDVIMAEIDA